MNPAAPRPRASSSVRAFTLVELLTVIAIVGILAAILIPTVGRVRDSARSTTCSSNLRQLSAACLLYAGENKGRLVPLKDATTNETWRIKIEPYLISRRSGQSPLICPSDPITDYPTSSATGEWPASYGLNSVSQFVGTGTFLEYNSGSKSKLLPTVNNPSRLIMITDIGRNQSAGAGSDPSTWTEDRNPSSSSLGYARFPWGGSFNLEWSVWPRHGNGRKANAAFYDGRVAPVDLVADLKNHPNGDPLCLFDNH